MRTKDRAGFIVNFLLVPYLDVLQAVCDSLYDEFKQAEYAPPALLRRMVAAGRLGRKSGRGFYDYEPARETAVA